MTKRKTPYQKFFFCLKHRDYQAEKKPRCDCNTCWTMWYIAIARQLDKSRVQVEQEIDQAAKEREHTFKRRREKWEVHPFQPSPYCATRCKFCGHPANQRQHGFLKDLSPELAEVKS